VLVLGVGGNVSQGILKALALARRELRVVAACVSHLSAGLYTVERAFLSPFAEDPDFLDWLLGVCEEEGVVAVLSGVASGDREAALRLASEVGFPLVAKPRRGKRARGVIDVDDESDLAYALSRRQYVVQERLPGPEFTVACFSDRAGAVRGSFVMRRELSEGTTLSAEVGDFPAVREYAERVAERLRPLGPSNVQIRLRDGEPVCHEINVRFSGTAPIRARLGFNDVEATVLHHALGEDARDLPSITEGVALRYWNEIYVEPAAVRRLEHDRRLDEPRRHSFAESFAVRP
jgi:carbamoyl-phosphate synthase large subunit